MRTISAALKAAFAAGTGAACLRYTRRPAPRGDGAVFGATSFSQDLTADFDGTGAVEYVAKRARPGFSHSASIALDVDTSQMEGFYDTHTLWITPAEISAGLWKRCRVDLFHCDRDDLSKGAARVTRKYFGDIRPTNTGFSVVLVSLSSLLTQRSGPVMSATCDLNLGDPIVDNFGCGFDTGAIAEPGTVESSAARDRLIYTAATSITQQVGSSAADPIGDNGLRLGMLTFATGANAGQALDIKANAAASREIRFFRPAPYAIAPGDTFMVHVGCDNLRATCKKFGRLAQFTGYPDAPTPDNLAQTAGTA